MKKHLIIEGMDGSGKDHLIEDLMGMMSSHTLHERASTSIGGPVDNLVAWTESSVREMTQPDSPLFIYNRHPLISEPIYAPFREVNGGLRGSFRNNQWLRFNRGIVGTVAILVICDPGWATVRNNLLRDPGAHMPGVIGNATALHNAYRELVWPGVTLRYSYKRDTPQSLVRTLSILRQNRKA